MAAINRLRSIKNVGVLADKNPADHSPTFRRYNLIYGFNASGKSTLSRIFAALGTPTSSGGLPENSSVAVEMDDGTTHRVPHDGAALADHVCVFNTDFIQRSLRWEDGTANPIFYISEEQSAIAASLREAEHAFAHLTTSHQQSHELAREKNRTLAQFRTRRAQTISAQLHLAGRQYEANHLKANYQSLQLTPSDVLDAGRLKEHTDVIRRADPPPPLEQIRVNVDAIREIIERSRQLAETDIGDAILDELNRHPAMLGWVTDGYRYHEENALATCLFCGSPLSEHRKRTLSNALNAGIRDHIERLKRAQTESASLNDNAAKMLEQFDDRNHIPASYRARYDAAADTLVERLRDAHALLGAAESALEARVRNPAIAVDHSLPALEDIATLCSSVAKASVTLNTIINEINERNADFQSRKEESREVLKRHYLAETKDEYETLAREVSSALQKEEKEQKKLEELGGRIEELRAKVKEHGPAAQRITELVHAYLGHSELTVEVAQEGYELHRHGRIVEGPPSEGEKTAIALCYFLSTLTAEGRSLKNCIVVVDDPISSLDSRATNYACALLREWLKNARQAIVLTHDLASMNEFKKGWRKFAYPRKPETQPTGSMMFLDVRMPTGGVTRASHLIELPPLLREYDSEYHFLCSRVFGLEKVGEAHSEYDFMMPNIIRRVLEVFLAFRVPGTAAIEDKLGKLTEQFPGLEQTRVKALVRLAQVESHSDSLDDLVGYSRMTVEEIREANAALIHLMGKTDEKHASAMRRQSTPKH